MKKILDNRPPFVGLASGGKTDLLEGLPTPAYLLDADVLRSNGEIHREIMQKTGCKILLAQKAFSCYDLYPLLAPYLAGTEASGLYEARLGREEMPSGEVHVFSAAYRDDQMGEILRYADHIVFNSPAQIKKFGRMAKSAGRSVGLRINPECSTQTGHTIYDPCAPGSRLGATRQLFDQDMDGSLVDLLDGLHFHTLCEQNSDDLITTLNAVEEKFGDLLPRMRWLNMGGGHHITRPDYDRDALCDAILRIRDKYGLDVYLEPGESCALNAGYLITRVLDVHPTGNIPVAILDASAACHAPDVLEMPYRPPLYGSSEPRQKGYTYRLGGPTCLAGDLFGDYSFDDPLSEGDLLIFGDMAIYTICKNNTFNGMPLPSIYVIENGAVRELAHFGYEDFKGRLGGRKQE